MKGITEQQGIRLADLRDPFSSSASIYSKCPQTLYCFKFIFCKHVAETTEEALQVAAA